MTKVTMPDPVASITINPIGKTSFIGSTRASEKLGSGDFWLISIDQAEAYANARVREVLDHLDGVLDEAFSRLQTDDKSNDFWMGVGSALEVAEKMIRALIQKEQT